MRVAIIIFVLTTGSLVKRLRHRPFTAVTRLPVTQEIAGSIPVETVYAHPIGWAFFYTFFNKQAYL